MITIMHVGIIVLAVGGSIILTATYFWFKNRKIRKYLKELTKRLQTLSKQERDAYLKNGGNIEISDKEVLENERQSELRRRKLSELRELEATNRGAKKPAFDFSNYEGVGGRANLPLDAPNNVREGNQEPRGANKKIRFSGAEEF